MRILIISTFFPPLNSIASLRPYSWARYWSQAGHEVTVLTTKKSPSQSSLSLSLSGFELLEVPLPDFLQQLKGRTQGNKDPIQKSIKNFLLSHFHKLREKKGIYRACRMPDFTDFWIRPAYRKIENRGSWDLIVSSAGPYPVHFIAEKLKRKNLAKFWIADFRDPWVDNHIYPGIFPLNFLEKYLEKKLMRSADKITTVSDSLVNFFSEKYGKDKVYLVENGFDPVDLITLKTESSFPDDGKIRIAYTGSFYPRKQDPTPLFQAIFQISRDEDCAQLLQNLEVLFFGPSQKEIERLIEEYKLSKWVKCRGFLDREEALRIQRDANFLLFLPWTHAQTDGILTGKVFEYLFSKTPILSIGAHHIEASQKLILNTKAGYIFNDRTAEIKEFILNKLKNPRKEKISVDPTLLNPYTRQSLAMKMLDSSGCL